MKTGKTRERWFARKVVAQKYIYTLPSHDTAKWTVKDKDSFCIGLPMIGNPAHESNDINDPGKGS